MTAGTEVQPFYIYGTVEMAKLASAADRQRLAGENIAILERSGGKQCSCLSVDFRDKIICS